MPVSDSNVPASGPVVGRLRAAGCVFAEEEAELLLAAAADGSDLDAMVERRCTGEPLEQILGFAEFRGLRISVEPGVFVPRRRTEFLVECALIDLAPEATVVDLCCGTAAVGVAIRHAEPSVTLLAADVDPDAVRCARRNVGEFGVVFEGDLYDALPRSYAGRVDLLAVNAPYVPTDEIAFMPSEARDHEHPVALDGGADGLHLHRRVASDARRWLRPGGRVIIETSVAQADRTADACRDGGLTPSVEHSEKFDATVVVAAAP